MPPARNNIVRLLPPEAWDAIARLRAGVDPHLVDGGELVYSQATVDEIKATLRGDYPGIDQCGPNAFTRFWQGDYYRRFTAAREQRDGRGDELRARWLALAGDGDPLAAGGKLAAFAALQEIMDGGSEVDPTRRLAAIATFQRAIAADATVALKARIAELEAQLAAALGVQAAKPGADPAEVQARLDAHLGVKPMIKPVEATP